MKKKLIKLVGLSLGAISLASCNKPEVTTEPKTDQSDVESKSQESEIRGSSEESSIGESSSEVESTLSEESTAESQGEESLSSEEQTSEESSVESSEDFSSESSSEETSTREKVFTAKFDVTAKENSFVVKVSEASSDVKAIKYIVKLQDEVVTTDTLDLIDSFMIENLDFGKEYEILFYAVDEQDVLLLDTKASTEEKVLIDFEGITFESETIVYDGREHELEAKNVPAGAMVQYENEIAKDTGTYKQKVTISADGYKTLVLEATITITKAESNVTEKSLEIMSYGKYATYRADLPFNVVINGHTFEASFNSSYKNYEYKLYFDSTVDTLEGENLVKVIVSEDKNHKETTKEFKYDIHFEEITGLTLSDESFNYDGEEHSLVVLGNNIELYTITYKNNKNVNAGTYDVEAEISREGYKKLVLTAKMTILQLEPTFTQTKENEILYKNDTITYTSNVPFSLTIGDKKFDAISNGETYKLDFVLDYEGKIDVRIVSAGLTNIKGFDKTFTYDVKLKTLNDATMADLTVDYDNTIHSLEVANVPSEAKITYENNDKTDAGEYVVKATIELDGFETKVLEAKLTINKLSGVLTKTQVNDPIYYGDKVTYSSNVPFKLNGTEALYVNDSYEATYEFVAEGENKVDVVALYTATNCDFSEAHDVYNVIYKDFTNAKFESKSYEYTGDALSVLVTGVPNTAKITYTNNEATEIGTYNATAVIEQPGYHTLTLTATLEITKIKVEVNASSTKNLVYGGVVELYSTAEFEASLDGITYKATKNDEDNLFYAVVTLTSSGEVKIHLSKTETEKYAALDEDFVVKVDQASSANTITVHYDGDKTKNLGNKNSVNANMKYDGTEKVCRIEGKYSFKMVSDDETIDAVLDKESGNYVIELKSIMPVSKEYKLSITDENVKEFNGIVKFKVEGINQKKVDSNLKSSIEYKPEGYKLVLSRSKEDGAKFVASIGNITKEAILDETTGLYSVEFDIKDAQIYTFILESEQVDKWKAWQGSVTVEIVKANATLEALGTDNFVYDAKEHTVTFKSNTALYIEANGNEVQDGEAEGYDYSYVIKDAGTYKFDMLVVDSNYIFSQPEPIIVTVAKSDDKPVFTLDGQSDSFVIQADGQEHTFAIEAQFDFEVLDTDTNTTLKPTYVDSKYVLSQNYKESGTHTLLVEYVDSKNFNYEGEEIKVTLIAEALPEFTYSMEPNTSIDYDSLAHDVIITEKEHKDFTVTLGDQVFTAVDGTVTISFTNAGEYNAIIKCGAYENTITYTVNKISLPYEVFNVAEDDTLTPYVSGTETYSKKFIVKSDKSFGIGEDLAVLNEEANKYELSFEVETAKDIDVISMDDNYSDVKFNANVKELSASKDLSDKPYNSIEELTLSNGTTVKVTVKQGQNSTNGQRNPNGYCVGSKSSKGTITLLFEKNISEIKLNLGSWDSKAKDGTINDGKGEVDINGKKFNISGISNDVTLSDLDTNKIVIASSEKDYRFFLRGIEVMYK